MSAFLRKSTPLTPLMLLFLLLLAVKFLAPLFLFEIPLGYDPGIYRYLFLRHAEGFPPLFLAEMDGWAYEHPLGLFMFSTVLLRAGLPVDWLVGWMWNSMAIALVCVLAGVTAKREGKSVGVLVLLAGALSAPYYDGFTAMYWKAYLALLFMILTFHLIHKKSWWAVLPAILTLITHNQTGLLFALVIGTWWFILGIKHRKDRRWQRATGIGAILVIFSALLYIPVWQEAIGPHLRTLLTSRGENAPAGSFPPAYFYLKMNGVLLLAGLYGLWRVLQRDRTLSVWSLAVLWSAVFVVFKLFFYLRFFLHLDFFLLPFAAFGIVDLWKRYAGDAWKLLLIILLTVQGYFSYQAFAMRSTDIDVETFQMVKSVADAGLSDDATVLTLENKSTTWLRGWLPYHRIAGPGLFDVEWMTYDHWVKFIYGTHEERTHILKTIAGTTKGPIYLLVTPLFYEFYSDIAEEFLQDSCFNQREGSPLLEVTCLAR